MQLADFRSQYAGSACWMLGAGPSLLEANPALVQGTAACRFGMNFAGRAKDGEGWHIKPTLWTTFDPTTRFSRCVFLDPSITKFVRNGRDADWLPESHLKVKDAPNVYGVNMRSKSYETFFDPFDGLVNNSRDSFIMALDIAVKLGFRKLYCIGTELRVRLSREQIQWLQDNGCDISDDGTVEEAGRVHDRLDKVIAKCREQMDKPKTEVWNKLQRIGGMAQYSFTEEKPITSAIQTDKHYWDTVQYLRQARRQMSLYGIEIINCCAAGRLAPFFRTITVEEACAEIDAMTGTASEERTRGKYTAKADIVRPYTEDIKVYGKTDAAPVKPCRGARCRKPDKTADQKPEPAPEPVLRDSAGEVVSLSRGPHPARPIFSDLLHNPPEFERV